MPVITFGTLADDPLGTAFTFAEGINGLGQIVGEYLTTTSQIHGFLYTNGDFTTIDDPLGSARTHCSKNHPYSITSSATSLAIRKVCRDLAQGSKIHAYCTNFYRVQGVSPA